MGTVFAEGIHKLPHIPSETLGCGLTKPNWWLLWLSSRHS
jgi:hypothetical protein